LISNELISRDRSKKRKKKKKGRITGKKNLLGWWLSRVLDGISRKVVLVL
jgi:hypothetical protein